jgi:carboxylesterase type B
VIVYIHGGKYNVGSGVSYASGPRYLLDKDVVLVTINYRLGVMG